MRFPRIAAVAFLSLVTVTATAQVPHQTLYPGLTGTALLEALRAQEPVPHTLGYGPARDSMYTYDQRTYGRVRGVYTGYTITLSLAPGIDASTDAYTQHINAEHTWPQSQGASAEPQKSDLHNLFPARDAVNSSRGNLPFGESPDAQTATWYRDASRQSDIPTTDIDEWSERLGSTRWEPREDHKGNVARAMFYFAMRWPAASQTYLAGQIDDLVAWNDADPVDVAEYARMEYNARLQGNRNPFIADPTLARRAFRPGTVSDDEEPEALLALAVWPNPTRGAATVRTPGPARVSVTDALGREVWRTASAGETVALPAESWAPGVYAVRVTTADGTASARFTVAR